MTAADRPSVTDNARAEAERRYRGDWDPNLGKPVDDWGFSEAERRAFVAGTEWAAGRAETTTATNEDALAIRDRLLPGALAYIEREGLSPTGAVQAALRMGAEAGLLATARTRPTREEVLALIPSPQRSIYVEEWPEDEKEMHRRPGWRSFTARGEALDLYRRGKVADAVMALLEGGER